MKLSKDQLNNWIDDIYVEKTLNLTEQKDEIQRLVSGVAPLNPSFILNQSEITDELKNSFKRLYNDGSILETFVVVGNPGDGKSHLLNSTNSFLKGIKNNIIINERAQGYGTQFNLLKIILKKANSQETLKAINKKVMEILGNLVDDPYIQINKIASEYDISMELAKLIWLVAVGENSLEKIKALNILTLRDTQPNVFQDLGLELDNYDISKNALNFFYILMKILKESGYYFVILIEELEHLFKWEMAEKQKFYEQLKEFIDNAELLGNMRIIMFSTHVFNEEYENRTNFIQNEDPALHSRLLPFVRKIKKINSKAEAKALVVKLKEKYNVIYPEIVMSDELIIEAVEERVGNITTYRNYIQKTLRLLEDARTNEKQDKKLEIITVEKIVVKNLELMEDKNAILNSILSEREKFTTIALKKRILLSIEKLLVFNEYKDISLEVKKGYLYGTPKNKRNGRMFYLDYTPKNKVNDKYNALINLQPLAEQLGCDRNKLYFIYIKDRVTITAEQKMLAYNPNINMICIDDDDINELLILTENVGNPIKLEVANGLSNIFKLEVSN